MLERDEAPLYFDEPAGVSALWFGVLAGPAAWLLHLNVSYALVRYVCASGAGWLLHLATLAMVALAAAGGIVALRSWRKVGEPKMTGGGGTLGRTRFMSIGGLALSAFFLFVILMAWLPDLILSPCEGG